MLIYKYFVEKKKQNLHTMQFPVLIKHKCVFNITNVVCGQNKWTKIVYDSWKIYNTLLYAHLQNIFNLKKHTLFSLQSDFFLLHSYTVCINFTVFYDFAKFVYCTVFSVLNIMYF